MKKSFTLLFLTLILGLTACQKDKGTQLSLDNGNRWKANIETTQGVNNLIHIMGSFEESDTVETYNNIGDSLMSGFKMIFKKCTMEGDAHNQLHDFLFPMKKMFKKLESDDIKICKQGVADLNKHLPLYAEYFE